MTYEEMKEKALNELENMTIAQIFDIYGEMLATIDNCETNAIFHAIKIELESRL